MSGRHIVAAVSEYSSYCRRSITKAKGTTLTSPIRTGGFLPVDGGVEGKQHLLLFSHLRLLLRRPIIIRWVSKSTFDHDGDDDDDYNDGELKRNWETHKPLVKSHLQK